MVNRKISVALECFIERDGKYLMLHRSSQKKIMPDVWMAPGGRREFCEGLFAAARREVIEETGLKIKNLAVKATGVAYMKDIDLELHFHFVTAEYDSGTVIQDPEDGELVWLTPEEIYQLDNLLAELKPVLPHVLNNDPGVISYRAVYETGNDMTEFSIEQP